MSENEGFKPKPPKEIIIEEKSITTSQHETPSSFHSPLNLNVKNLNLEIQV